MDLTATFRLLLRWWWVAIPLLALSLVAAVVATSSTQPEYTADGQLLFVAPRNSTVDSAANPLLEQPAELRNVAALTELSLRDPQIAAILASEGLSTNYLTGLPSGGLPMLGVLARADSREKATGTVLRLMAIADDQLQLRQDTSDVLEQSRVRTEIVTVNSVGGADYGGRTRFRIVILAVGALLTFGIVHVLESIRLRRLRQRRFARRSDSPAGEAAGGGNSSSRPLDQSSSDRRVVPNEGDSAAEPDDIDTPSYSRAVAFRRAGPYPGQS